MLITGQIIKIGPTDTCKADFRDSVGIRTQDPQLRRLLLYPAELPNRPCRWKAVVHRGLQR